MNNQPINPKESNQNVICAFIITLFNAVVFTSSMIIYKMNPISTVHITTVIDIFSLLLQIIATALAFGNYKTVEPRYKIMAIISLIPFGLFCCMLPIFIIAINS